MGSPADLAAVLHIAVHEGPPLGFHLNHSKSLLYIPEDANPALSVLLPDIPTTRRGFTLLGCPIRPPDYCKEVFSSRLLKVKGPFMAWAMLKLSAPFCALALPSPMSPSSSSVPALPATSSTLLPCLTVPSTTPRRPLLAA